MILYLAYILVYEYEIIFVCSFIYIIVFSIHTCIRVNFTIYKWNKKQIDCIPVHHC